MRLLKCPFQNSAATIFSTRLVSQNFTKKRFPKIAAAQNFSIQKNSYSACTIKPKNIQIDSMGFSNLRKYLRMCLDDVKAGNISSDEFIDSIESCFSPNSPLHWEDAVLMRAVCKE